VFWLIFRIIINLCFICYKFFFIRTISTTIKLTSLFDNIYISTIFYNNYLIGHHVRDRKGEFLNSRLFRAFLWQFWPQSYKCIFHVFVKSYFIWFPNFYLKLTRNYLWTSTTFLCRVTLFCPMQIVHARENTTSGQFFIATDRVVKKVYISTVFKSSLKVYWV
jgi:hypothetical protein